MQAHPFDFVSALSAEAQCPVCREPHAAVDACLCSHCQTRVCADCSSLLPDTHWACAACVARLPQRAYPLRTGVHAWLRVAERRLVARLLALGGPLFALPIRTPGQRARLVEQIVVLRRALTARLQRAGRGLVRGLSRGTTRLWVELIPRFRVAAERLQGALIQRLRVFARERRAVALLPRLRRAAARLRVTWIPRLQSDAARVHGALISHRALIAVRLRALRGWWVDSVRSSPLRAHAVSLVVATLILVAVARAEAGPDAR